MAFEKRSNEMKKQALYQRQSSKCKDPGVGFWFVCLQNFKEATHSDWSRMTWGVAGRCVWGRELVLGHKADYIKPRDFILGVMGSCISPRPLRNKCQERMKDVLRFVGITPVKDRGDGKEQVARP